MDRRIGARSLARLAAYAVSTQRPHSSRRSVPPSVLTSSPAESSPTAATKVAPPASSASPFAAAAADADSRVHRVHKAESSACAAGSSPVQQSDAKTPPSSNYNSTVISGSLVPPYETEGGHVPIYSMSHGLIQKRNWIFRNPQWCDLCKEPVALWVNHHGRKDHALMDMHYTALAEFKRRWNPEAMLECFLDSLGVRIGACHKTYGQYEREHRNELYAMLVTLEEAGMLYFGEPRHSYLHRMQGGLRGMDHQGALVLHEFILGPFMRLYPDGHIQDYSNLVDFVTCSYNMETVYDLCGLYTLDTVALKANFKPSSPAALGLGGIAASSSATSGFQQQAATAEDTTAATSAAAAAAAARSAKQQEDRDEEAFSRKAVFVRQLLGQMRWLTQPGQEHPAGFTFPPHIVTLGELCLRSLVVEIIAARLCEYMVRAEPVWRSFGYERKKLHVDRIARAATDVVPAPVKYFYRPMSPAMDDLFATERGSLEDELAEELRRKKGKRSS